MTLAGWALGEPDTAGDQGFRREGSGWCTVNLFDDGELYMVRSLMDRL